MEDATRTTTPQGILRAGAVLTRSGPFAYRRDDLGLEGDPDRLVTVERTIESLTHPDTLASLRGAPITVDHPAAGVTPDNWAETVVGHVVGEPTVVGGAIVADVMIGDADALAALDDGKDQLSIGGYSLNLDGDWRTDGPLICNHLAIVDRGRAGRGVRVLDNAPPMPEPVDKVDSSRTKGASDMDDEAISAAVDAAAEKTIKQLMDAIGTSPAAADAATIRAAVEPAFADAHSALAEIAAGVQKVADQQAAQAAADDEAARKARAEKAADALAAEVRAEERQRHKVLVDAMPLLDDAQRAELADADPHDILVAALGDTVADAKSRSTDYLLGALEISKAGAEPAGGALPAGVSYFDAAAADRSAHGARSKAMRDYIDAYDDQYAKAGGT